MKTFKDKLEAIYDGWKNTIFQSAKVEELAKARALHCAKCDSNVANVCKECGCPLWAKTRSTKETNKCDLGKWEE
jgi:hypothetical protein